MLERQNTSEGQAVASASESSSGGTKKELAKLPSFEGGKKKSPYLKFPVWKKNWEELTVDHDAKWWHNFLFSHLEFLTHSTRSKANVCNFYQLDAESACCLGENGAHFRI